MAADTDMEFKVVVEEEEEPLPHLVRDTAKKKRTDITKMNLILFMRAPRTSIYHRLLTKDRQKLFP